MPTRLDPDQIGETIARLCQRVESRFPGSGLAGVGRDLSEIARLTKERIAWIGRPILGLRVAVALLIALIGAGLVITATALKTPNEPLKLVEFVQGLESGINDILLVGAKTSPPAFRERSGRS